MAQTGEAEELPFRPRARLLQLLGDQLIGTPRLAVFELVKNAYDADASEVIVTLTDLASDDPTIIVQDDGSGMTADTVREIWLVPADDHREKQRERDERTANGRLPLGEKGLGRFAVHKLGDRISMVTRASGKDEVVIDIDWRELLAERFLSDTRVPVRTRSPEIFTGDRTGTRITVTELRERDWTRGEVRRLHRQITSISSPFSKRSDKFRAELRVPEHRDWIASVPDVPALLKRAPWKFRFSFKNGVLSYTYEFRGVPGVKVAKREVEKETEALLLPPMTDIGADSAPARLKQRRKKVVADADTAIGIGPVRGTFWVFDRDRDILANLGEQQLVENYLDENGGVRVYRDGIRVYNYGERDDDWLGLDLRRVNTPTRNISRNIVVGAIDLKHGQSTALIEKTNREGFVENDAYVRFRRIVLGALGVLETERKIDKDRVRDATRGPRDPEVERLRKPLAELRAAAKKHRVEGALGPIIDRVEHDYDELRSNLLRASVSGVGLAVVFHEIEQGVRLLYDAIRSKTDPQRLQGQAQELIRILDGFSELLRKGDRKEHSLRRLVRRARDLNVVRFTNHNIRLVAPVLENDADDLTATFAFGLVLGGLNNALDNAIHWLKVRWPDEDAKTSPRAIFIDVVTDLATGPSVVIADTGPGFVDEPDQLVSPFFSRRPDGMGIGLYYANLVMELNGGALAFPERDDIEMPDEFTGAVVAFTFPGSDDR